MHRISCTLCLLCTYCLLQIELKHGGLGLHSKFILGKLLASSKKIRKKNQRKARSKNFDRWFKVQCICNSLQTFQELKHINTYSGIFRRIWAYSGITLCNPSIFKTLNQGRTRAYSEPRGNIQNSVKYLQLNVLRKQLKAVIIFAISVFHVFYFY